MKQLNRTHPSQHLASAEHRTACSLPLASRQHYGQLERIWNPALGADVDAETSSRAVPTSVSCVPRVGGAATHSDRSIAELIQELIALLSPEPRAIADEQVAEILDISTSAVWALCTPGSPSYDESFPKPKRYKTLRRTVWNRGSVLRYLERHFSEEQKPTAPAGERIRRRPTTKKPSNRAARRLP